MVILSFRRDMQSILGTGFDKCIGSLRIVASFLRPSS